MSSRISNGMIVGLPKGIILSKHHQVPVEPWERMTYNDNVLIVGGSGSGKTHSIVKPNLMQIRCSYVVIDLKGNLYRSYSPGLRSAGYDVHQIDFTSPETSESGYNPFLAQSERAISQNIEAIIAPFAKSSHDSYWMSSSTRMTRGFAHGLQAQGIDVTIEGLLRMFQLANRRLDGGSVFAAARTGGEGTEYDKLLAKTLGVNLGDEATARGGVRRGTFGRPQEDDFDETPEGQELKQALDDATRAFYDADEEKDEDEVKIYLPDGSRATLGPNVKELTAARNKALKAYSDAHFRYKKEHAGENRNRQALHEEEMKAKDASARDSLAWRDWEAFRTLHERTYACVMDTIGCSLGRISPAMAKMLSRKDAIDLSRIGDRPTALFVKVSDTGDMMEKVLVSMFESDVIGSLCRHADAMEDGRLEQPVQIILDDFTSGPMIPNLVETIATVRSRGIGMMLLTQSIGQILSVYGRYATSILSNCDMQVFLDVRGDPHTLAYLKQRPEVSLDMFPPGPGREIVIVNDRAYVDERFDPDRHPNAPMFRREQENSLADEMLH
jgi:hypothetical protein